MFGTLKKYKDKQFCEEHPTIRFSSLYEENEYKIKSHTPLSGCIHWYQQNKGVFLWIHFRYTKI